MSPASTAEPVAAPPARREPPELPFESGDHMDQKTFHALYEQTPDGVKAELIGGIVYVASPVHSRHGRPHSRLDFWLNHYAHATPGTDVLVDTTTVLGDDSEPQPDVGLFVLPEHGGQVTEVDDGPIRGAFELVAEVAHSSAAIDLHAKKRDYEKAGVREYVVVLARPRQVRWFGRGPAGRLADLPPDADGLFRSRAFPGLWLDPAALFDRSRERLLVALRQGLATPEHAAFAADLAARAQPPGGPGRPA